MPPPLAGLAANVQIHFDQEQRERKYQEDTYCVHTTRDHVFVGIFDGHNGDQCSEWCKKEIYNIFLSYLRTNTIIDSLIETFEQANRDLRAVAGDSGTTCSILFLTETHIYAANVGDSHMVYSRDGEKIVLTESHRVDDGLHEAAIVLEEGGTIIGNRVDGQLALTRSLGDHKFQPAVSYHPFISWIERCEGDAEDSFIIIATDGLWDAVSKRRALEDLQTENDPVTMVSRLMYLSNNSRDNTTIGVLLFRGYSHSGGSTWTFAKEMARSGYAMGWNEKEPVQSTP